MWHYVSLNVVIWSFGYLVIDLVDGLNK